MIGHAGRGDYIIDRKETFKTVLLFNDCDPLATRLQMLHRKKSGITVAKDTGTGAIGAGQCWPTLLATYSSLIVKVMPILDS